MTAKLKVCWISAGVSSFIAGYLLRDSIDQFLYIDIENQHPDSLRFIKDCEKVLGKEVKILKPTPYTNTQDVIKQFRFINSPGGAKCTEVLKNAPEKLGSLIIGTMISPMFGDLMLLRLIERKDFTSL